MGKLEHMLNWISFELGIDTFGDFPFQPQLLYRRNFKNKWRIKHFITHKSMRLNLTYLHQINLQILNFYAHEAERGNDPKESLILGSYSYGKLESSLRPCAPFSKSQTFLENCSNLSACETKS